MGSTHSVHQGGLRPYIWFLSLTLFVLILEVVGGIKTGSLALIADALGHAPIHLVAGGLAIWAWRKGLRTSLEENLLRHRRVSQMVAGLIVLGALIVGWEAIVKLWSGGKEVHGWLTFFVALIGLIANAFEYNIIWRCDCDLDLALLADIKSDSYVSVAIVISSFLIGLGAWSWLDTALSLIAVGLSARLSWKLFFGEEHHH